MSPRTHHVDILAKATAVLAAAYVFVGLWWVSSQIDTSTGNVGVFAILLVISVAGVVGCLIDRASIPIIAGFFLLALSFWQPALSLVVLPAGLAISGAGIVLAESRR